MLIRLVDASDRPVWVNARQVRWLRPAAPGRSLLGLADETLEVQGEAPELANQLQDALAGRKYVDFWSG